MAENESNDTKPKKKAAAPKPKVAATVESHEAPRAKTESRASEQHAAADGSSDDDFAATAENAVKEGMASASSWLDNIFPGHGNAVLFAIIGFVGALLLFQIGFWRTLLIVILVVVGIAYGQYLDGNPKIYNAFKKKFGSKK